MNSKKVEWIEHSGSWESGGGTWQELILCFPPDYVDPSYRLSPIQIIEAEKFAARHGFWEDRNKNLVCIAKGFDALKWCIDHDPQGAMNFDDLS